jgi:hypothetical protein
MPSVDNPLDFSRQNAIQMQSIRVVVVVVVVVVCDLRRGLVK